MPATHVDIPSPFPSFQGTVLPEWIDWNGHMNIAYYVLAFDRGTDALFDFMGLNEQYRQQESCSVFTVELHVNYLREIKEGDAFKIVSHILGVDEKRVQVFHHMYHTPSSELVATNENMFVHIDMNTRRSSPFSETLRERIEIIAKAHASLPQPDNAGRGIGFRSRP